MSRAYRKVLKEKELAALEATNYKEGEEEEDASESEDDGGLQPTTSAFAALMDPDDVDVGDDTNDEDEKDEEEVAKEEEQAKPIPKSNKNKKQEKRSRVASNASKSSKKKNKGKSKVSKVNDHGDDDDLDEIDRSLKEINEKFGKSGLEHQSSASSLKQSTKSLLSVDSRFLNAEAEMKKLFGSRVVEAEMRSNTRGGPSSSSRRNNLAHKHVFSTPKDTWPRIEKMGLDMESVGDQNGDGCTWFKFKHNLKYQEIQCRFFECVATHDPNTLSHLLNMFPYHIDCLLQLSEVCRHSGDWSMGFEFLERALYSFEKAFHPLFNLSTGLSRLDYNVFENRSFFITLFVFVQYLGRRGCWRTAMECCKVLISLSPETDPMAILLFLDFYAIKCGEHEWFLKLYDQWEESKGLDLLPMWPFGKALATFISGRKEESEALLIKAIGLFPWVVGDMLSKCGSFLDSKMSSCKLFTRPTNVSTKSPEESSEAACAVLIDLFIERSHSLYKEPENLAWFRDGVIKFVEKYEKKDPDVLAWVQQGYLLRRDKYSGGIPRNIYRHIVASDLKITSIGHLASSDMSFTDPVPPLGAPDHTYTKFLHDREEQRRAATSSGFGGMGMLNALAQSLLPWMNLNNQEPGVIRGAPGVNPNGNANGNNVVEQMSEEDLIAAANAALPGLFPEGANPGNIEPGILDNLRGLFGALGLNGGNGNNRNNEQGQEEEGEQNEQQD